MTTTSEPGQTGPSSDFFSSIETGNEIETKVKGSRFIGQAFRANRREEIEIHLTSVRKRYHDASHHCSAYRLGTPESFSERADDDGEPSGTAGVPILGAIRRENSFDCLVVVTRYFGGTKLGTGGLVRAYGEAARLGLEEAPERVLCHETLLTLQCGYGSVGAVEAVLAREGAHLRGVDREFEADPLFRVRIRRGLASGLEAKLIEATAGKIEIRERIEQLGEA